MEDYKLYEEKLKKNKKRNERYINEFEEWLNGKNLVKETIQKHLNNVDLYINDYLNYCDINMMEDGAHMVYSFLGGWFIEKCLWATKSSIKETAASIKKFYQCMSEKKYISDKDYKSLCDELKNGMDDFLDLVEKFDNGTYYDMFN